MKAFIKRYGVWLALLAVAVAAAVGFGIARPQVPQPLEALLQASEGLDDIIISARLNPEEKSLSVNQTLQLVNRTGQKQDAVVLRTWPNAFQSMDTSPCAAEDAWFDLYYPEGFSLGALVMSRAQVEGESVLYRYADEAKTVLMVPVPGGWEAGETVNIELSYAVQMPAAAYRFGLYQDIWAIGNAFAIPAVWEDGGFRTDAYAPVGDPFVSDCANYRVTVAVPEGYVCAGSAYPQRQTSGNETIYTFSAPAVRDFALVVSSRFHVKQKMQNGVLITACAADAKQAKELLRYGCKTIKFYQEAFGTYPYPSYTLAEVAFPNGGMEYPALSMIASDMLAKGGRELEYVVAHETAHQWWYAVVGSDSWYQAWQDEALCEFSMLAYVQERYGQAERDDLEYRRMESSLRVTVPHGVTPGAPLDYFASMNEYSLVVYDRGAACLCALNRTVPLETFLRDYYQRFSFLRATRQDFEEQLLLSTGEDLIPLMRDYLDTYILN